LTAYTLNASGVPGINLGTTQQKKTGTHRLSKKITPTAIPAIYPPLSPSSVGSSSSMTVTSSTMTTSSTIVTVGYTVGYTGAVTPIFISLFEFD
jgi:hypothetical protein